MRECNPLDLRWKLRSHLNALDPLSWDIDLDIFPAEAVELYDNPNTGNMNMDSYDTYASPGRKREAESFSGRAPAEYRRRSPGMLAGELCVNGSLNTDNTFSLTGSPPRPWPLPVPHD